MATTIGSLDLASLKNLRDDLTQYFWFESNASATYGAGVHVTLVPDTTFMSNPTGQNILMNTDGISIRNGLLPMMTLDNDSLDFNVIDTTAGTYTTTATFTATGAQIGQSSAAHSVIDANGQRFYASDGSTLLANIGYGKGKDEGGSTSSYKHPYYTFGTRKTDTDSTRGYYSMVEGIDNIASGYCSHAEGSATTASESFAHAEGAGKLGDNTSGIIASGFGSHAEGATQYAGSTAKIIASGNGAHAEGDTYGEWSITSSGYGSHAEGRGTTASGSGAHAEGQQTVASGAFGSHAEGYHTTARGGYGSHAEGYETIASGVGAHASGHGTVATEAYQTVIGKFNSATRSGSGTSKSPYVYSDVGDFAFIIGKGTGDDTSSRSNALTVDWNGYIWTAKDVKTSTIVNIITANSTNATIASANYVRRGNIAQITISWTNKSAISVGESGNITNIQVGTLVSGKRPLITTGAWSVGDGAGAAWYNISTGGAINLGACEARKAAYTIAAGSTFWICSTFLVD